MPAQPSVTLNVDGKTYQLVLPNKDTDYIQKRVAEEQVPYELPMLQAMAAHSQPGQLVLDVGANVGNHSLYLAAIAGVQVVSYEPNRELATAISESARLNGLETQVTVRNVGVGSQRSHASFRESKPDNLGAQSLAVGNGEIEVVRLDDEPLDGPIAALKVDVEGMELDVLKGAEKLLRENQPLLYIECQSEHDFQTISGWLAETLDYRYVDTFNATPTHLFCAPRDLATVSKHARRSVVSDLYQKTEQLSTLRGRLQEANQKYRQASERIDTLKSNLSAEKEVKGELEEKLASARDQANESKKKAEQLAEELMTVKADLTSAREKYRTVTASAAALKEKVEAKDSKLEELSTQHSQALDNTAHLREKYQELEQNASSLKDAYEKSREDVEQLENRLAEEVESRTIQEEELTSIRSQYAELLESHEALGSSLAEEAQAKNQLNEELLETQAAKQQVLVEFEQLNKQFSETKAGLVKAGLRYRILTSEEIPKLKTKIKYFSEASQKHYANLTRTAAKLSEAERRAQEWEAEALRLKSSYAYKLGYHLRAALTSPKGFARLPVALWRLHKAYWDQARTRKQAEALRARQREEKQKRDRMNPRLLMRQGGESMLKVACIMDEFTFGSYSPEASFMQLTPTGWKSELEDFQPELLFIESAWRGKNDLWDKKVPHTSQELQNIVAWCREKRIPTVFWNKEDPIHFETFLTTAKLFDHVFTTDIDCIHRYKALLGHEKVYFLPFACQPKVHNPIELYRRKDAFCFAGAYYVRYPERTKDLKSFVEELPAHKPLEIYDRNYGKDDSNYQFPDVYQPYIVGTLPFEQIDKAYKGYNYAINLNSIKQSQSMFARRVYELLGSNTITISNFSRGLRQMFGDLVIATDSGKQAVQQLKSLEADSTALAKLKLAALRKVMAEHTYRARFDYVTQKALGFNDDKSNQQVTVIALTANQEQLDWVQDQFNQQSYAHKKLLVVAPKKLKHGAEETDPALHIISTTEARKATVAEVVPQGQWVAVVSPNDYYGINYLTDMMLAREYTSASAIGKGSFYAWESSSLTLKEMSRPYTPVAELPICASVVRRTVLETQPLLKLLRETDSRTVSDTSMLSVDPFNYCKGAAHSQSLQNVKASVDDLSLNSGYSLAKLVQTAESIPPMKMTERTKHITGAELISLLNPKSSEYVEFSLDEDRCAIESTQPDGVHSYFYADTPTQLADFELRDELKLHMDVEPGLNIQLAALFLEGNGQRIGHAMVPANRNFTAPIPQGTEKLHFGLRVYAAGRAMINALEFGHKEIKPAKLLTSGDYLLLTNHYPSYDDLYRNGFVHSRVKGYKEAGLNFDVFRLRENEPVSFHEFEDADVVTGAPDALDDLLASGQYRTVAVHFLSSAMWEVLKKHIGTVKVIVWLHGADVQLWHHRECAFETEAEIEIAKRQSDQRYRLWSSIFSEMPDNLEFVFVSNYLANQTMEDYGVDIPASKFHVIPNPIDTELFSYQEKNPEQRRKILSIRPYASKIYANDLAVEAVLILAKKPFFDELEFKFIGEGTLFEETLKPLRDFRNVSIEQRFLNRAEISKIHKEYGIFLCPSRMDTQGVSRDEAMASGLVPVCSNVAAVPEFVDERVGVLAKSNSPLELADAIEFLYRDKHAFLERSPSSACHVRSLRSNEAVLRKEIASIAV